MKKFIVIIAMFATSVLAEGDEMVVQESEGRRRTFTVHSPGPLVTQSIGKIWPKPQVQAQEDGTVHTFDVANFLFEVKFLVVFEFFKPR